MPVWVLFCQVLKGHHLVQAAVAGSQTVVGPGPSPPTITETHTGGQIVRAGHKRFFFDLGSNAKGKFLRITEVRLMCSMCSLMIAMLQ